MLISKIKYIGIFWFLPLLYLLPILVLMEFQYKIAFFILIYFLTTFLLHYSHYDKIPSWKLEYKLTNTQFNIERLPASAYILKIYDKQHIIKSFKVIKNN